MDMRSTKSGRPRGPSLGKYDVEVVITKLTPDEEIAWTVERRVRPHARHLYGYQLEPTEGGTRVTSDYDRSEITEEWKRRLTFPVVPESSLKATLGILERTVHAANRHLARVVCIEDRRSGRRSRDLACSRRTVSRTWDIHHGAPPDSWSLQAHATGPSRRSAVRQCPVRSTAIPGTRLAARQQHTPHW